MTPSKEYGGPLNLDSTPWLLSNLWGGSAIGDKRVRRSKELKFKIALEAIRGEKQLSQIAEEYHVHPQQVTRWK